MPSVTERITIDVISDVVCPWCYVGKRRLEKAVAAMSDTPVAIRWHPFQLDATIPPGGIPRAEYLARKFGDPERIAQIQQPVLAAGAMEGIVFQFNLIERSPNTIDAHRLVRWAQGHGREDAMVERLFQMYFLEGRDIGASDTMRQAAADVGLDDAAAGEFLAGAGAREEVIGEIQKAVQMGVTGVPTFIIAGRYAIVGAQESRYIAGAIAKARADRAGGNG
jgi:predicted DsbA family dithiol-disulfide isomerase